jgi:hypothetical protein
MIAFWMVPVEPVRMPMRYRRTRFRTKPIAWWQTTSYRLRANRCTAEAPIQGATRRVARWRTSRSYRSATIPSSPGLTRSPHALRLQEVDAIDTGGPDEIEKHQCSLYPRNSTGEGDEETKQSGPAVEKPHCDRRPMCRATKHSQRASGAQEMAVVDRFAQEDLRQGSAA